MFTDKVETEDKTERDADTIKAELKANTEEAMRRGVFGSPTFFADDGEMFWGNDRLEDAFDWLAAPLQIMSIGGTR